MNLAVNARDAMPGGGTRTIGTSNVEMDDDYVRSHMPSRPGPCVMLTVSDSGVGMDAPTRARIFEPFFTTKGQGKGTGLGLSTVYGIVQQSGGYIHVFSDPGRGATFKISLPRVQGEMEPSGRAAPLPATAKGTETILVVEDSTEVRSLVRTVLARAGYRILEASGGAAALSLSEAEKKPIDLLLTDVVMPEMSGREVSEHLSKLRPGMKVLFMSGYTDDSAVTRDVIEEGSAFLQKPFTTGSLIRKVREVLDAPVPSPSSR